MDQFEYKIILEFESQDQVESAYQVFKDVPSKSTSDSTWKENTDSDNQRCQDWRIGDWAVDMLTDFANQTSKEKETDLITSQYLGHGII